MLGGKAVLRGVDLVARPGEVLGVLGPSGAGKSTLFRVLVGETVPESGTVELHGTPVTSWPLWRRARAGVGYVPQGPSVLWDLTVRRTWTPSAPSPGCRGKMRARPPPAWGSRSGSRCARASSREASAGASSWPGP